MQQIRSAPGWRVKAAQAPTHSALRAVPLFARWGQKDMGAHSIVRSTPRQSHGLRAHEVFAPGRPGRKPASARQGHAPEAVHGVVVDHADRLHPRVDDGRPHEPEAALLEVLGDAFGQRRGGGEMQAIAL